MILNDRRKEIYQNYSVCENDCTYEKMDLEKWIAACECSIKHNIEPEVKPPSLNKVIKDSFEDSNLAVIKCYNLVFNFKIKEGNIGFWIFSVLIFLHIPLFIFYFIKNIYPVKKFIITEMSKFHYWKNLFNPKKKKKR